jgi:hypothetical protein
LRAPVLVELSEPVRLTVTTEAEEKELDREEYRWCLGNAVGPLPPLDMLEVETEAALPCMGCIAVPSRDGEWSGMRYVRQSTMRTPHAPVSDRLQSGRGMRFPTFYGFCIRALNATFV